MSTSLCYLSAAEMVRLLREKQVSSRELIDAHLEQIERVNPHVNAIVTVTADLAQTQAKDASINTPLYGLPIVHKDLFDTAGIRTTYGSPLYRDQIPTQDDVLVEHMSRAGAITIGKTNTPEFGAGSQTFNKIFGATRNPYDLTKTCGGSSGGSAVALACGMAPIATGTDLGGSLRNPAAYCNVVGLRPSVNLPGPRILEPASPMNTSGFMARSVADLALAMRFTQPLEKSFRNVRVAWFRNLGGTPFDPRLLTVINSHRATFEALGLIVEEAEPYFSPAEIAFRILRASGSAAIHGRRLQEHPDGFKDALKREIEDGMKLNASDIARAEKARTELSRGFQTFLEGFEYFILPTTQVPPFDIDVPYPSEIAGVHLESYIDWMKSCWYISATGHPACSVPAGFTSDGLPVGIQIVGRHHADFSVLQMAYAFEQATGYGLQRPAIAL